MANARLDRDGMAKRAIAEQSFDSAWLDGVRTKRIFNHARPDRDGMAERAINEQNRDDE